MRAKIASTCMLVALVGLAGSGYPAESGHVYATRDVLELDTCASAWLIKRFVDEQAEFRLYPRGELITEGVVFNTPEATYRRTHNESTYEVILRGFEIEDEVALKIGEMVHDVEISYSMGRSVPGAYALNEKMRSIIEEETSPQRALEKTFVLLDELYQSLAEEAMQE